LSKKGDMNQKGEKISIVLPTYNERNNIVILIKSIHDHIPSPLEIIVVDDNSPDGTADAVADLSDPDVVLIRRKARGLAAAFHRGILESTGDIVCWMDADTCMPPPVLANMIKALDENDIAIGSRYAKGGSDNRAPVRVYASRLINGFARFVLGGHVRDYDSGFVALKREVFNTITIIPFGYGEYFIEMVYDALRAGLKVAEVGYAFKDRTEGYSKSMSTLLSFFKTGLHYVFRIISIKFRFLRGGDYHDA